MGPLLVVLDQPFMGYFPNLIQILKQIGIQYLVSKRMTLHRPERP